MSPLQGAGRMWQVPERAIIGKLGSLSRGVRTKIASLWARSNIDMPASRLFIRLFCALLAQTPHCRITSEMAQGLHHSDLVASRQSFEGSIACREPLELTTCH
jgi:hypothetical protein